MLVVLAGLLAIFLAACGDDDDGSSSGGESGALAEGGEVTISQTSQPDYLDPALTYTVNGIEPLWLVYTPLLTYAHEEGQAGAELIPGLAEDLPEVSEDGLTYELTLRDGLKYSDGTPAVASDFEHTIKRVLNLESGGSAFYQTIEGATEYSRRATPRATSPGSRPTTRRARSRSRSPSRTRRSRTSSRCGSPAWCPATRRSRT